MNFEKLLEYQKFDMQNDALRKELESSAESERRGKIKSQLNEAVARALKLNELAGRYVGDFNAIKNQIEENSKELKELADIFEESKDLDEVEATEIEHYLKQAKKIKDRIDELESALAELKSKTVTALGDYDKVSVLGKKLMEEQKRAEAQYGEKEKTYQARFAALDKSMSELRAQIPEETELYLRVKASVKRFPVVQPCAPKTTACPCCGEDLPGALSEKLKTAGGYAECERCSRLLFASDKK